MVMGTKEIRYLRQERTVRKLNGEVVVKPPRIIVRESAAVIPIIVENLPEIAEGIAILAVTFFGLNWFSTNVSPLLSNFFKSQQQQQQQAQQIQSIMSQLMPVILVMSIILGLIFVFMYLMRSQQQQPPPPPAPPTEIIIEK